MNKTIIGIVAVLMCIALVPVVLAGSVSNDCTQTKTVCVQTESYCDWLHHGKCLHHSTRCIDWEDRCVDSISSNGTVDADTVQGQDVVGYIAANENAWKQVGGGGMSSQGISRLLTGNYTTFDNNDKPWLYYLDQRFCSSTQYTKLENRVTMIEQFLIEQLDYNPDDKELEIRAALRLGNAGTTTCYEDGLCIRVVQ